MPKKKKFDEGNKEQEKEDFYDAPVTKPEKQANKYQTLPEEVGVKTSDIDKMEKSIKGAITREDVIPPVKKAVAIPAEKGNPYYKKTLWHNVKEVWQCSNPACGVFRQSEEAVIAHILIHVPRDQHKTLQAQLTKEIKK